MEHSKIQSKTKYYRYIFLSFLVVCIGFLPHQIFAKALTISEGYKQGTLVGNPLTITVSTSDKQPDVPIKFQSTDPAVTFTPYQCQTTKPTGSCDTSFTSTKEGTFNIAITAPGYDTASLLPIVVTQGSLTLTTSPSNPKAGDQVTVIATISDKINNITVTFSGLSEFTNGDKSCVTGPTGSCSITYTSASSVSAINLTGTAPGYGTASAHVQTIPLNPGKTCKDTEVLVNNDCVTQSNRNYTLLVPIPGAGTSGGDFTSFDASQPNSFARYLNLIIKLFIGICAVLAMVSIVAGGIQHMTTELVSSKEAANKRITDAVLGLVLALGAYTLLYTINPDILRVDTGAISQATLVNLGGDTNAPIANTSVLPPNIVCSGGVANIPNIAQSFSGKMTYLHGGKGAGGGNPISLDCSGFVNYVLKCANANFVNSGTSDIFSNAESVTSISNTQVNGKDLKVGDLIGWTSSSDKGGNGHVMIYIGNGQVADSHSGSAPGQALGTFSVTKYKDRIKFIKRLQ